MKPSMPKLSPTTPCTISGGLATALFFSSSLISSSNFASLPSLSNTVQRTVTMPMSMLIKCPILIQLQLAYIMKV